MTDSDSKEVQQVEPRERCPKCGELIVVESEDPLEEFCINAPCDYYRAERFGGGMIEE